jgi:hypothetical protein
MDTPLMFRSLATVASPLYLQAQEEGLRVMMALLEIHYCSR